MKAATSTTLAPTWTTPCCDRVPRYIGSYRYVCIVCGTICVDTALEVRAVFGADVERVITREPRIEAPDD